MKINTSFFSRKAGAGETRSAFKETVNNYGKLIAGYLGRKTAHWSPFKTKLILVLFCAVTGTASLLLVMKGLMPANGPPVGVQKATFSRPAIVNDSIIHSKSSKTNNYDNHK